MITLLIALAIEVEIVGERHLVCHAPGIAVVYDNSIKFHAVEVSYSLAEKRARIVLVENVEQVFCDSFEETP